MDEMSWGMKLLIVLVGEAVVIGLGFMAFRWLPNYVERKQVKALHDLKYKTRHRYEMTKAEPPDKP